MACRHLTFQGRVAGGLVGVAAQEVADGEVAELVVASGCADVQVMRARPFGRLGEEVVVRRLGRRDEEVPDALQRLDVPSPRLDRHHGELKVEDGLARKSGHCCRAHVLQANGKLAECMLDATHLCFGQHRPHGVVVGDANGRVEPVIKRRMSLQRQNAPCMRVQCISPGMLTDDMRADLARLLAELDPTNPPTPGNLEALLDDPSAQLILATNDPAADDSLPPGACIGMLTLTLRNSLTRRTAHVDHVVVDTAHRRAGIATRLVEEALRLAAAEGASRVDLSSSPDRVEAQALYESLGFEQRRTTHWRRPL